ncbi:MAG TPA: hypothetical protein VEU96_32970 [Bryobacteraceae bacterium]|nr:hypothetical protein [Bryobacteraceae bacterium]
MRYVLSLVAVLALAATSEMSLTVEKLVTFIRSSVQMKQPDKQVAEYLKHVKLTQKLDDQTIEDLQNYGAGPKTIAVLKDLGETSAKLPDAPPPPVKITTVMPGPDSMEQAKILDAAREYVMNYTKQLPNFICVEVVRRDVDPTGTGRNWRHIDTDTIKVSYFENHEDYQVVLVNNQPVTNMKMEQLGGTVSQGEFGSMMREIFDPESHTRFAWDHWATLRGRRTYVFAYEIEQMYSKYHVSVEKSNTIVPGYRGQVFIDQDTNMVTKVTLVPYDMPLGYPIREIHSSLDYEFTKIGDAVYMLPIKALVTSSRTDNYLSKNDIEFRAYRKFGTETTIKFETPEPLPEETTKEKPLEPKKKQ